MVKSRVKRLAFFGEIGLVVSGSLLEVLDGFTQTAAYFRQLAYAEED